MTKILSFLILRVLKRIKVDSLLSAVDLDGISGKK
jgi:hypothetical protein